VKPLCEAKSNLGSPLHLLAHPTFAGEAIVDHYSDLAVGDSSLRNTPWAAPLRRCVACLLEAEIWVGGRAVDL